MRKISFLIAALCIAAMMLALTACGNSKPAQETTTAAETTVAAETTAEETTAEETTVEETTAEETEAEETTEEETEAETEGNAAEGGLTPSIVIEFGDAEAISDLAKKAQNFEVEEGTVAQISGVLSTDLSNPSVQEEDGEGKYVGLTMFVDGDWEKLPNKTEIDVTGTFVKGQYYMEFHVDPENIKER
ncbi:MAG: hypothetical protein IJ106_02930 [Parasporobacterium sp.]|nr:hypothetical protein [Parasporobacterium sp.]